MPFSDSNNYFKSTIVSAHLIIVSIYCCIQYALTMSFVHYKKSFHLQLKESTDYEAEFKKWFYSLSNKTGKEISTNSLEK